MEYKTLINLKLELRPIKNVKLKAHFRPAHMQDYQGHLKFEIQKRETIDTPVLCPQKAVEVIGRTDCHLKILEKGCTRFPTSVGEPNYEKDIDRLGVPKYRRYFRASF